MARLQDTFTLPCGHLDEDGETLHTNVTVIELGHDTDKDMSSGMSSTELVAQHVVQIGPHKDKESIKSVVEGLEKGDFDWILIRLRILSLGSDFEYPHICPNTACRRQNDYSYDMDEIDVVDMPDPLQRTLDYTTRNGEDTVWRTLKAKDMEDLAEIMQESEENRINKVLALQLVSINGETPAAVLKKKGRKCKNSKQHINAALKMIEELEILHGEREVIRKELRELRGYPNLNIRNTCTGCGTNFPTRIPIDYTFIAPSLREITRSGSL